MKRMTRGWMVLALAGTITAGWTNAAWALEEVQIDVNFDDGDVDGFVTYTNGGEFAMTNENGELACSIVKCGSLDYANQVYYDGFSLEEGCEYNFSFDVHCDIERKLEYRLQLNGGDYHAYMGDFTQVGPQIAHVETTFVMAETTDPAPRLAFNMGYEDDMTEDPGEHKICFDNVRLIKTDDSGAVAAEGAESSILLGYNQVGYRCLDEKKVIAPAELTDTEFSIRKADTDEEVYHSRLSKRIYDEATGQELCFGDFSKVEEEGSYVIIIGSGEDAVESAAFPINDQVYDDLYGAAVKMLTTQRCSELSADIVGEYAHPACHTTEALIYGTSDKKEVCGGWHDAGDYGRYVVPGAKAVADLFLTFEMNEDNEAVYSDALGIPESGNQIPDLLDEARFELEWMLKMQDEATGGVYHKVTCRQFPGSVMPQDETDELVLAPISLTATGDFAAVMAKASVVYAEYDEEFAQTCAAAAERAWDYVIGHEDMAGFTNPSDIATGEYPDDDARDEICWAAAELALADLAQEAEILPQDKGADLIVDGIPTGLGWMDVGLYGLYDLAMKEDDPEAATIVMDHADIYFDMVCEDVHYCSLGTVYPWGSNMSVANTGMIFLMADRLSDDEVYMMAAKAQLNYLLGNNGTGYCYVTGFGSNPSSHPHHRPSEVQGEAVPGMLVGGPNGNLEDPYAAQVLAGKAPGLCYADNQQSYSTNEVAIYWNSPLICLLAGI